MDLLAILVETDGSFMLMRSYLALLDRYAVRYRYPGEKADRSEALLALRSAETVRRFIRPWLGLAIL